MPANPGNQFQRKWTDEERDQALQWRRNGMGLNEIQRRTGIPSETVRAWAKDKRFKTFPRNQGTNDLAQRARDMLSRDLTRIEESTEDMSHATELERIAKTLVELNKLSPAQPTKEPKSALEGLSQPTEAKNSQVPIAA